ncbi:MAG TPA: DUF3293 domain-containing protein [Acidimicrobiales bacterium]|nr:DUF3293 domain-containing protein [Acidimicrobiales bacterium]
MELLAPDDPWAAYARTVVVVAWPGGSDLEVEAAPLGSVGSWPFASDDVVHVLTAWDPGDARPGEKENRRRQAALEADLRLFGSGAPWLAVGPDPVSGHREVGVAVCGLGADRVLALGARFGQDAIFEWTPDQWAIVACRGARRAAFGWSLRPR